MAHGSVIVDMAAEQGGNCALTEKDKVVEKFGVTIIGLTDLPSRMAHQSSELYATVAINLLKEVCPNDKGLALNVDDEIHRGVMVLQEGKLMWPPPKPPAPRAGGPATPQKQQPKPVHPVGQPTNTASPGMRVGMALAVGLLATAGILGPPEFLQHLTVFLLACVIGWHVVWNVTPALHTPLMSVTNAISGIILIGGMVVLLARGAGLSGLALGGVAVLLASINVAGGFLVTQRMLRMFRK
jgi:NAD(P) transhydrogenase subunit alpha